jgi:hypothetical protein
MVAILCAPASIFEFRVRSRASLELELIALRHQVYDDTWQEDTPTAGAHATMIAATIVGCSAMLFWMPVGGAVILPCPHIVGRRKLAKSLCDLLCHGAPHSTGNSCRRCSDVVCRRPKLGRLRAGLGRRNSEQCATASRHPGIQRVQAAIGRRSRARQERRLAWAEDGCGCRTRHDRPELSQALIACYYRGARGEPVPGVQVWFSGQMTEDAHRDIKITADRKFDLVLSYLMIGTHSRESFGQP